MKQSRAFASNAPEQQVLILNVEDPAKLAQHAHTVGEGNFQFICDSALDILKCRSLLTAEASCEWNVPNSFDGIALLYRLLHTLITSFEPLWAGPRAAAAPPPIPAPTPTRTSGSSSTTTTQLSSCLPTNLLSCSLSYSAIRQYHVAPPSHHPTGQTPITSSMTL